MSEKDAFWERFDERLSRRLIAIARKMLEERGLSEVEVSPESIFVSALGSFARRVEQGDVDTEKLEGDSLARLFTAYMRNKANDARKRWSAECRDRNREIQEDPELERRITQFIEADFRSLMDDLIYRFQQQVAETDSEKELAAQFVELRVYNSAMPITELSEILDMPRDEASLWNKVLKATARDLLDEF